MLFYSCNLFKFLFLYLFSLISSFFLNKKQKIIFFSSAAIITLSNINTETLPRSFPGGRTRESTKNCHCANTFWQLTTKKLPKSTTWNLLMIFLQAIFEICPPLRNNWKGILKTDSFFFDSLYHYRDQMRQNCKADWIIIQLWFSAYKIACWIFFYIFWKIYVFEIVTLFIHLVYATASILLVFCWVEVLSVKS